MPDSTTRHRPLNKQQLSILYLLYSFRFGTTDLFRAVQSKNISRQYINKRLQILLDQEYIGRKYDNSYKLQAKFASYYLLPKGIARLKQEPDRFRYQVLRNIRKDNLASNRFIKHSINIFSIYAALKSQYGDTLKFYTKSHYITVEYFPMPLTDAYFSIDSKKASFFVECFDSTMPQSVMKSRIERLIEHADSGDWPSEQQYPGILLVCDTSRMQTRVRSMAKKAIEDGWVDDLDIRVTLLNDPKVADPKVYMQKARKP